MDQSLLSQVIGLLQRLQKLIKLPFKTIKREKFRERREQGVNERRRRGIDFAAVFERKLLKYSPLTSKVEPWAWKRTIVYGSLAKVRSGASFSSPANPMANNSS